MTTNDGLNGIDNQDAWTKLQYQNKHHCDYVLHDNQSNNGTNTIKSNKNTNNQGNVGIISKCYSSFLLLQNFC